MSAQEISKPAGNLYKSLFEPKLNNCQEAKSQILWGMAVLELGESKAGIRLQDS